ncbi:MAG: tRNA uridine-5-carboxymethylaminomethyl(34) synthesis GTPase MnmE [Desulfurobacteriaceae bacterium]
MKDYFCEDTIAAIGTPIGKGAIGIVRISGNNSLKILKEIFRTKSGKKRENFEDRKMHYGLIVDQNEEPVDEVLAVYMKAPKTFTGEDVVEIHSHGGIVIVRKILRLILTKGARLAEPGEFTLRAVINGKIDLVQAEAINELINAQSETGARLALKQLEGKLSEKIKSLRDEILEIKAFIEAAVDFPEEDIEVMEYGNVANRLKKVIKELDRLISSYKDGKVLKEGIKVAIVGRPNVGKSSLLNAILKEERAIVTEIPGTTRDIIEETITFEGIPIKLIDTAGIREAQDKVEKIGIERSLKSLEEADVILFVIDGSCGYTEEDEKIAKILKEKKNVILVVNKRDLGLRVSCEDLKKLGFRCITLSAKSLEGIENLSKEIKSLVLLDPETVFQEEEILITNERHKELLEKAKNSLEKVLNSIQQGFESPEFLSIDLDEALVNLGKIVGYVTTEDMFDIIFSKFCIGK